jgi:hypothetical protein
MVKSAIADKRDFSKQFSSLPEAAKGALFCTGNSSLHNPEMENYVRKHYAKPKKG